MENLNSITKPALMELARQHNIHGRSTMNKAQLISALTPLMQRRANTPASSSSSSRSSSHRHTVIVKFTPLLRNQFDHLSPSSHIPFLIQWFRRECQFYVDELYDNLERTMRIEGIYGSRSGDNMYIKISYTGQVIPNNELLEDIMKSMLDPDDDGNRPLEIQRAIGRGRTRRVETVNYLIRGNNEMEIVNSLPANVQSGGSGNINMTELTNALTPIPDRQIELATKIEKAAKDKGGISKSLLAIAHELRTNVFTDMEFIQIENYIHMVIGKSKLPTIKESSSEKKVRKRGRKSSNSDDSAGHDKYGRVRTYQTLEGGSGAFNMDEMNAALAIPVEQLKLADDIHKNIFLADPGIRGGLQKIADKLRVTPMKPEQFIQLKAQVKKIIGKYGSETDSEPETSKSSSSSRKKRQAITKRKRSVS
jgi:hypothetical protein